MCTGKDAEFFDLPAVIIVDIRFAAVRAAEGIVISVRLLHPTNAEPPIDVTPSGILI